MVEVKRCLDTYALIEIVNENSKFAECLNKDNSSNRNNLLGNFICFI